MMTNKAIADLSVAEIMRRWPSTIHVFIALKMHCVGCPISPFHTLADAADEHRIPLNQLLSAIDSEIAHSRLRAGPVLSRRR